MVTRNVQLVLQSSRWSDGSPRLVVYSKKGWML